MPPHSFRLVGRVLSSAAAATVSPLARPTHCAGAACSHGDTLLVYVEHRNSRACAYSLSRSLSPCLMLSAFPLAPFFLTLKQMAIYAQPNQDYSVSYWSLLSPPVCLAILMNMLG